MLVRLMTQKTVKDRSSPLPMERSSLLDYVGWACLIDEAFEEDGGRRSWRWMVCLRHMSHNLLNSLKGLI